MGTQHLGGIANRRQRIAQLMSQHGEKFVFLMIDGLQSLFGLAPLSYVQADTHNQRWRLIIDTPGACMYPAQPAGRVSIPILRLASAQPVARIDELLQRVTITRINQADPDL